MARGRNSQEKKENKQDKFKRVVTPRIQKAIKAIHLIGNCASSGYDFTEADREQIGDALVTAVSEVMSKFTSPKTAQQLFKFK